MLEITLEIRFTDSSKSFTQNGREDIRYCQHELKLYG